MIFVGIDIGFDGGIAIGRSGGEIKVIPMPIGVFNGRRWLDIQAIRDIFSSLENMRRWNMIVTVERQTRGYRVGEQVGTICTLLTVECRTFNLVRPQDWQREFGISSKCPGGTKAASIRKCHELFPDVSLRRNDKCRVDHDGMADALLIAEYGRRVHEREAS